MRAGLVDEGTTHGKKMHAAAPRGHADVSTTANIHVQGSPADLEEKLRTPSRRIVPIEIALSG